MTILRQLGLLVLLASAANAAAPAIMTYQGRLKEGGVPVTGTRTVGVYFCNAPSGGTCLPSGNNGDQTVAVSNGVFAATYTVAGWDPTAGPWYLEVRVTDNPLTPREYLTATPYAIYASSATTLIADGGPGVTISTPIYLNGTLQPAVSGSGQGSLYFDSTVKRFEISENAGAYAPLGGYYRLAQGGLSSAASSLTVSLPSGFSPRNLRLHVYVPGKAASDALVLDFNGDGGANYSGSVIGFGAVTAANGIELETSATAAASYATVDVMNVNGSEKLAMAVTTSQNATGSATAPTNFTGSWKWTGSGGITSITLQAAGGHNLNSGTEVVVYAGD